MDVTDPLAALSLALHVTLKNPPPVESKIFVTSGWMVSSENDRTRLMNLPGYRFEKARHGVPEGAESHSWTVATSSSTTEYGTLMGWTGDMPFSPNGYVSGNIAGGLKIVVYAPSWIPPTVR